MGVSSSIKSTCGCRCECVSSTSSILELELEGVAMAGLVAILRQLGDLAELAAEIFDDLQGQVMAASARGRRLTVRAKQLLQLDQADLSSSSSSNSAAAPTPSTPIAGTGTGMTTTMPRLVAQHIKRCRGPPRLSLLDRFDAAGHGACLKRYTDPSFFRATHHQSSSANKRLTEPTPKQFHHQSNKDDNNSETPDCQSAHTDCSKSEADASQKPSSPGFLSMLLLRRQLKHRQTAGAGAGSSTERRDLCSNNMQVDKANEKLQGAATALQPGTPNYCSDAAGSCQLERTSSFEAWLSPDARFTATTHLHEYGITQEPPDDDGTTCNIDDGFANHGGVTRQEPPDAEITCNCDDDKAARHKGGSFEMPASRVSSLPRKLLFINLKHHNNPLADCSRSHHADSLPATGIIGDCNPEAIPIETFLPMLQVHSDPASSIHNRLPQNANQCSNSRSIPETCGDPTCTPDCKNLLLSGSLHTKRAGVSCSQGTRVDTPPLPPIPPIQWLSEKAHTGPRAASPKHRAALWGKSQKMDHADRSYVLHSVRTKQVAEKIQARSQNSHGSQTTLVDTKETDEMKCSEEISTRHPFREDVMQASEGIVLKAGEFSEPAVLPDQTRSEINLQTQAQADTCFQQEGRQQFGSTEKLSEEHEAVSDSSSNVSVFFSAVQQLAKMSPPSVPSPKYSLLDVGSHGRITLRNGPSPIHPSRNILDSRSVLLEQIKDKGQADRNDVEGEVSWSNSSE